MSAASDRSALQVEVDRMDNRLAERFSSGDLGTGPGAFQHSARVLRQARARLVSLGTTES